MPKVIIVGAGLAGLSCAVACRQNGIEAVILEQMKEVTEVGAGIGLPPNASRVMKHMGLYDEVLKYGTILDDMKFRRYENGKVILLRPMGPYSVQVYGAPFIVIHRHDYHKILYDTARELGVEIVLDAVVKTIDFEKTEAVLKNGNIVRGDIIVGADGLWSQTRSAILRKPSPPLETGDLAYRAIFKVADLEAHGDPGIKSLLQQKSITSWVGPNKHCVVYPVRQGKELNMVLLRPDNLPPGISKTAGELDEMKHSFEGWDPILTTLISCIPSISKWKLCHSDELESWHKNNVVIIGDACHPTLPYQAQGAAMAVEDGAVIGHLLGRLTKETPPETLGQNIPKILKLFEDLRKRRTTLNVEGAIANRRLWHMVDGEEQRKRDETLRVADWRAPSDIKWIDPGYQNDLLGFDAVGDADKQFDRWREEQGL